MYQTAPPPINFSLAETRHIIKDLFQPKPWIYWTDFLLSITLGSACFLAVAYGTAKWSLVQLALFLASGVLFYRAVLFTHEMVHMRANTFRLFRIVWNLLCGIPFLIPSFMYYTHVDHHMRSHYGTHQDGEYLPFASLRPIHMLFYIGQAFVLPLLGVFRFLVLTPLCWISPRLRQWAQTRASSMVIDPAYIRPLPTAKALRIFRLQETACFLLTLLVAVRFCRGNLPVNLLIQTYLTAVLVLILNNVRARSARHRYTSGGHESTFVEQLLDSVNYPRFSLLTPLWAPIGLRYHALHHLCPSLPYHAMGAAHRRLMEQLPADSPYRQTNGISLWRTIAEVWQMASETSGQAPQPINRPTNPLLDSQRGHATIMPRQSSQSGGR